MDIRELVNTWFKKWEVGDFHNIPVTEDFKHTSPFGTIEGKKKYLELVETNKDKFLNQSFEIHHQIYEQDCGCVRYTANQGDFTLEVSEWYFLKDGLIAEIIAYYHIGDEIREDRKLSIQ